MVNNTVIYEAVAEQYLHSILDISGSLWLAAWLAGVCALHTYKQQVNEFAQHGGDTPEIAQPGHLTYLIFNIHVSLKVTYHRSL